VARHRINKISRRCVHLGALWLCWQVRTAKARQPSGVASDGRPCAYLAKSPPSSPAAAAASKCDNTISASHGARAPVSRKQPTRGWRRCGAK